MGSPTGTSAKRVQQNLLRGHISTAPPPSLEVYLENRRALSRDQILRVRALRDRQEVSNDEILTALGLCSPTLLAWAHADRLNERYIDLAYDPASPSHVTRFGAVRALQTGLLPWRQRNGYTVIATHRPELFDRCRPELEDCFGPVQRAFACPISIRQTIADLERGALVQRAETRVRVEESCRTLNFTKLRWMVGALLLSVIGLVYLAPVTVFASLTALAVLTLLLNTGLKLAAAALYFVKPRQQAPAETSPELARLPVVSVLVPLFKEEEIATQLVTRLKNLKYPRELLDVILVVEEDDQTTAATLARTALPTWITTLKVPQGGVKTKPRALNYALDYCRGSIVGVYDAEDAPDPYQIQKIVKRFAECGQNVVCLQGILDFYNARSNWMARCFTTEYATWFRIVLPGLQKMGLPVPLGGTTLFFRRDALEKLGGWDAHNVTEDADLGIRLARYGYTTEMVDTVTMEEANNRAWPWVRQRSRWLKGFAITYAVHMRKPRALWNDLGPKGFFGVQLLFGCTITQFLLAPLLWTFWLAAFGLPHPLTGVLPHWVFVVLGSLFLSAEILTIAVGMLSVTKPQHRHLIKWVPTLHFYFPLGAFAAYKAMYEIITRPFYWDKTTHGIDVSDHALSRAQTAQTIQKHQASNGLQRPRLSALARLHRQMVHLSRKSP